MNEKITTNSCHATGINSSFIFNCFAFVKFNMPGQKSDKNNGIRVIFFVISIFNVNVIKIYIKKPRFYKINTTLPESSLKFSIF